MCVILNLGLFAMTCTRGICYTLEARYTLNIFWNKNIYNILKTYTSEFQFHENINRAA